MLNIKKAMLHNVPSSRSNLDKNKMKSIKRDATMQIDSNIPSATNVSITMLKYNNLNVQNIFANDNEYNNLMYYPSSSKEWFNSVYSYNKSYTKSLINVDKIIYDLFKSYFNMIDYKIKKKLKRKRVRKNRNSANRIYVSRAEVKHTNNQIFIVLYIFNKQKQLLEQKIKKIVKFIHNKKKKYLFKEKYLKYKYFIKHKTKFTLRKSRLLSILQKRFSFLNKWNCTFCKKNNNILFYLLLNIKNRYFILHKMYNILLLKKLSLLEEVFFYNAKLFNFNKSKFTNLLLNIRNIGLLSFIQKIYNKNINIKIVELKSIQLNSDVYSFAVALKLRNRKNKAIRVLTKALEKMVKIPDFHQLLTYDDSIKTINKDNILQVLKQKVVSGVRFEASGRLTRRLTASRAIFKYRYLGSLKNIRSSYDNRSSVMLRGYVKSNLQYILINSKTRNGSFGLKGWVSSH